ncbi:MAG: GGDEF domain-containing protein [Lachnospiraceae bacterium]|nr:GGDEF domain-containing protein [Lachnospiraceae bacterium]
MSYAIVGGLALILNLIINREVFQRGTEIHDKPQGGGRANVRYRYFVIAANCFFLMDFIWGFLYENRHIRGISPFLYIDCFLFFLCMYITMLEWIRYIVAYINKDRFRSKALLCATWIMFFLGIVYLVVNLYDPLIFYFDADNNYIAGSGRHIVFLMQIALYLVTSSYMIYIAHKSVGNEKTRYAAVGATCVAMEAFILFQIFEPNQPFYAMGLIIGICVAHSFIELGEQKEKKLYDDIARGLADDYAAMYYIDINTGEFLEYITSQEYMDMNIPVFGQDFYAETLANIEQYVYPDDQELARSYYSKRAMLANLEGRKSYSYKYHLMVDGQPRMYLFTLKRSKDGRNFVLYEKDIDADIKAEAERKEFEKKQLRALHTERELARRDELTGVRNQTAYHELEKSIQENIDNGLDYLTFALVVCDANNLKQINDTEGHVAGDEYIKSCAKLLCNIFDHSPVFRVGGDEFVVFLRSDDFINREKLMKELRDCILENVRTGSRPILASGMAEFEPENDCLVSDIFDRADKEMYENKQELKALK